LGAADRDHLLASSACPSGLQGPLRAVPQAVRSRMMKEPERLFVSDPNLARVAAMLERDVPPRAARERARSRLLTRDGALATASNAPTRLRSRYWLGITAGLLSALALVSVGATRLEQRAGPTMEPVATAPSILRREQADERQAIVRVEDLPTASPGVTS